MIPYDQDDLDNWALCVFKEARGDRYAGMQAVAWVIHNRVGCVGFPHDLHSVIFQKNAFTSMSVSSDPEFNMAAPGPDSPEYPWYQSAQKIVNAIITGADIDPTKNAHYYENAATATSGWFGRVINGDPVHHPLLATIGKQQFYL
jgi:spore germination cell wall hydrolase CwlJ-like protein